MSFSLILLQNKGQAMIKGDIVGPPFWEKVGHIPGQRWYQSKERWWFPIV